MFWLLLSTCVLIFFYLKFYKPLLYWKSRGIPYFKPLPMFGNVLPFALKKIDFISLLSNFYNDIEGRYCGIYQFMQPILLIKDIELIKNITIKDFQHFTDHKSLISDSDEPVMKDNIFTAKGKRWYELRSMISPAFSGSKMRHMYTLITKCAEQFTEYYEKHIDVNVALPLDMSDIFKKFSIDIISTCAYGIENNSQENDTEFYRRGKGITDTGGFRGLKLIGFWISVSLMQFFKASIIYIDDIAFFRNIVTKTIEYRKKYRIVRPDLINLMMEARERKLKHEEISKDINTGFATVDESNHGKQTSNINLTDDIITAQAIVFFIAGTDTTTIVLSLAAHELALNKDVQNKLQKEIDLVNEECKGKLSNEALLRMTYLDMVICETLRKWSPCYYLSRQCVKDYIIQPCTPDEKICEIKKGDTIWILVNGIHYDPKYFPDPNRFDPERFSDENKAKIKPYTFLPFGIGPRSCVANRFALLVMKSILFHILCKFDIITTEKTENPIQFSKSQIFMNPANGFWLAFKLRSK